MIDPTILKSKRNEYPKKIFYLNKTNKLNEKDEVDQICNLMKTYRKNLNG